MTFNENIFPDDFMVDSQTLQNLELSSLKKNNEAGSAQTEGDTADLIGTTEEN